MNNFSKRFSLSKYSRDGHEALYSESVEGCVSWGPIGKLPTALNSIKSSVDIWSKWLSTPSTSSWVKDVGEALKWWKTQCTNGANYWWTVREFYQQLVQTWVRSIMSFACCQCLRKLSKHAVGSASFGGDTLLLLKLARRELTFLSKLISPHIHLETVQY